MLRKKPSLILNPVTAFSRAVYEPGQDLCRLLIQAIRSRHRKCRDVPPVFGDEAAARDARIATEHLCGQSTPTNFAANEIGFVGRLEFRGSAHGVTTRNFGHTG